MYNYLLTSIIFQVVACMSTWTIVEMSSNYGKNRYRTMHVWQLIYLLIQIFNESTGKPKKCPTLKIILSMDP